MGSYNFKNFMRSSCASPWTPVPVPDFMQKSPNYKAGEDVLKVDKVDMCIKENSKKHHTDYYITSPENLIVRRGFEFRLKLSFNRAYDQIKDGISFLFTMFDDKRPKPGLRTLIEITPNENVEDFSDIESCEWGVIIEDVSRNTMSVLIKPAANCSVAQWKLDIDTKRIRGSSRSYCGTKPIYILFNPWCRDDQVYLESHSERKEYILNDTTLIWKGTYDRKQSSVWKIGQFEPSILDYSINMIAKFEPWLRGDPVHIARALSTAINSEDNDNGVMIAKRNKDSTGGTAPTMWIGSVAILHEYHKTGKPVKYGDCSSFAGVLTTICRAVGIPSRIVTNYSSAHDTQGSSTVDIFIDENDIKMEEETSDSIWNYRVWNELWMDRPDLGEGPNGSYGGWQAVDTYPQILSDGSYRCGPASVAAIKRGEILRSYDCRTFYSKVNADKIYWRYNGPSQPIKLIQVDSEAIGKFISTKAVGKWEREDITHTYKFEENSEKERSTMVKILKQSGDSISRYYLNECFNDVEFDLQLKDDILIGENFEIVLKITNKSEEKEYIADVCLEANTANYKGLNKEEILAWNLKVEIKPMETKYEKLEVKFDDYYSRLLPEDAIKISCSGKVMDTDWEYFAELDFQVRKPDIQFSLQGEVISNEPVDVIAELTNPLPVPIEGGFFVIEGPGLFSSLKIKVAKIPQGETAKYSFKFIPPHSGSGTLVAKFCSKNSMQMCGVEGYLNFKCRQ